MVFFFIYFILVRPTNKLQRQNNSVQCDYWSFHYLKTQHPYVSVLTDHDQRDIDTFLETTITTGVLSVKIHIDDRRSGTNLLGL
jgi:hypothetical protein